MKTGPGTSMGMHRKFGYWVQFGSDGSLIDASSFS